MTDRMHASYPEVMESADKRPTQSLMTSYPSLASRFSLLPTPVTIHGARVISSRSFGSKPTSKQTTRIFRAGRQQQLYGISWFLVTPPERQFNLCTTPITLCLTCLTSSLRSISRVLEIAAQRSHPSVSSSLLFPARLDGTSLALLGVVDDRLGLEYSFILGTFRIFDALWSFFQLLLRDLGARAGGDQFHKVSVVGRSSGFRVRGV